MSMKMLTAGRPFLAYAGFLEKVKGYRWMDRSDGELKALMGKEGASNQALRYSLLKEAILRREGVSLFDVQLAAAWAMEQGKGVQLPTGEGKTLAAVTAAASMAAGGKTVHIFVFNDYLAERDWNNHREVYRFFGLDCGCILQKSSFEERKEAYACPILYTTVKEAGFDFLKNFLAMKPSEQLKPKRERALVDEADSILIDEAVNPLVIAGEDEEGADQADRCRALIPLLKEGDVVIEEKEQRIWLTEPGIRQVEKALGLENLYDEENAEWLAPMNTALEAEFFLEKDRDYLVRKGSIRLIDSLTGRVAQNRRYPHGLHRAIEAKEGIGAKDRTMVFHSIPIQFFLLQYRQLAGMSGTLEECAKELDSMYGLKTVVLPPRIKCLRQDSKARVFAAESEKEEAVVAAVMEAHGVGQPVLLGTQSVREADRYSRLLAEKNIPNRVLSAANDAQEAELIARAGEPGSVTVSTNMAGRGVDIRLGGPDERWRQAVKEAGGLYVIGCGLNRNARVDRQLRGRAGRQGDPGRSDFFLSAEEPMLRWELEEGGDRRDLERLVGRAQRRLAGRDAERRFMLERYGHILELQRRRVEDYREQVLAGTLQPGFLRQREPEEYRRLIEKWGEESVELAERQLVLSYICRCWAVYLRTMENVRAGIHLTLIGGKNPLDEYHRAASEGFLQMEEDIRSSTMEKLKSCRICNGGVDLEQEGLSGTTVTWSYMVDESPAQFMKKTSIASFLRKYE